MAQTLDELNDLILDWATARNLIEGSMPKSQFVKTVEEIGELAAGIARNDHEKISDSIGDVIVTLMILAAQYDLSILDCLGYAYDEIKDRRGTMMDGIFIKEDE